MDTFEKRVHEVDVCVVGGGMAGVSAALAAARSGARTMIMQDRPVFGGNASSEIRMHICGAQVGGGFNLWHKNLRETGIIEELRLVNTYCNPQMSWFVWDGVVYDAVRREENLSYLLNCSCLDAAVEGDRLTSVTGWQTTTQSYHTVNAKVFVDCSGDSVLAPLSGAAFRVGREARDEFDESAAPEEADARTMGMSCLFMAENTGRPQPFTPPIWARKLKEEDLLHRGHKNLRMGYWWIELGGEDDTIRNAEQLRDELLAYLYGVWDHIKNGGDHGAENWALDWVQFLPGKRENRRYLGDHVLTQNDIEAGGRFEDTVAYGGWPMDDHPPGGILWRGEPTRHYPVPAPYGIPYRCLYSRNVGNLLFAGRNISATHMALSSTRVIATCAVLGQASGTAAALAAAGSGAPRSVDVHALQQALLEDDCFLPGFSMDMPDLTATAALQATAGDPEPLRNGVDRSVGQDANAWVATSGNELSFHWQDPECVKFVRVICDSDLNANLRMNVWEEPLKALPGVMLRDFSLELKRGGQWQSHAEVRENTSRLIRIPVNQTCEAIRLRIKGSWGADAVRLHAVTVHGPEGSTRRG